MVYGTQGERVEGSEREGGEMERRSACVCGTGLLGPNNQERPNLAKSSLKKSKSSKIKKGQLKANIFLSLSI